MVYTAAVCAVAGVVSFYLVEQYFSAFHKILIGWGFLGIIVAMYYRGSSRLAPLRVVFLVLSALLALRYFIWRTFETIMYTGPADFLGMMLLYIAEAYAIMMHFLGIFINIWPLENRPVPLPEDESKLPSVDIFIPTYSESEDIVRITATAATQIEYPADKLRIHILDDGGTTARLKNPAVALLAAQRQENLKNLAADLGISYITREDNSHAKAGNINNALKSTAGDLVLILDCDHVPTRDILSNTVGWFLKDPKLFLVQTPHFFINPTPVEKNLVTFSNVPGENDMFYRVIHLGLDSWNASYFCGSAALLKRSCLEEVGGISGETITEDAETSFILHSKGYSSVYINRPMVCGLSPETFDDYIVQRTRWAQGMIQLLMLKNPLLTRGLKLSQRLCYFNCVFFWFFGVSRFIFYLAPAAFLLLGLKVYHASVIQITAYALPYVISTFITMDFLYGKVRHPFFSEIYESVQSLFLIPAVFSAIINPRKPSFKVTPKGNTQESEYLNPMASTFSIVILVNLIAIPLAVYKWFHYPLFRDVIVITSVWCVFNILLALVSLGAFWEARQVRGYHRVRAKGGAEAFFPRLNITRKAEISDISLTGIGLEFTEPVVAGPWEDVRLRVTDSLGKKYEFSARVSRCSERQGGTFCGAEFIQDRVNYSSIVGFVYGDSSRWADIWNEQAHSGNWGELFHFMRLGIKGIRDSFGYLNELALKGARRSSVLAFESSRQVYNRIEKLWG